MIREANATLAKENQEYSELRAEINLYETRNLADRRDVERLENDIREATNLQNKYYAEI